MTAETPRDPEILFGRLVVEQGLARPEHVQECLRLRSQLAEAGVAPLPRLGELLVKRGYLTLEQVQHTMRLSPSAASPESGVPPEAVEGERVGRYVKTIKLGAGGMGEVWKAWDTDLRRWVALKFLKGRDAEEIARFRREAQTAANLTHPHIAAIYEATDTYIAMQFVDGQTLETFPRQDVRRLVELVGQAALAVHFAHEGGVIHRDVKPANIMVAKGHAYVMDFGLARSMNVQQSVSGTIVGTPAYMSPEQGRGSREIDHRTDVWSLGATLYQLLADRPPFRHENVYELLKQVIEKDPPPVRADRDLQTIVMKCLEKDPARRYGNALQLAEDLDRWLAGEAILAHPPSTGYRLRKWAVRRRAVVIPTLMAAVLGIGFGTWTVAGTILRQQRIKGGLSRGAELEAGGDVSKARDEYKSVIELDDRNVAGREGFERTDAEVKKRAKELEEGKEQAERGQERERREKEEVKRYAEFEKALEGLRQGYCRPGFRLTQKLRDKYLDIEAEILARMKESGESAQGWYLIGRCRDVAGYPVKAGEAWKRALSIAPHHAPTLLETGRRLLDLALSLGLIGHEDVEDRTNAAELAAQGERLVREGLAAAGERGDIRSDLAAAYLKVMTERGQGTFRAERMLEKWEGEPFVGEFLLLEGISSDQIPELLDRAAKAKGAMPSHPAVYLWIALCHAQEHEGECAEFQKVLDINPWYWQAYLMRGLWEWMKAVKLTSSGREREAVEQREAAIADFTKAIEINPQYAPAYANRAQARQAAGDMEGAMADCTMAIEIEPRNAVAYSNRSSVRTAKGELLATRGLLAEARIEWDGAIADSTKAIEINPRFASAYNNRGTARQCKGDRDGAIADFTKAIEINPRYAEAYYNRAIARKAKGDLNGAIEDYTKAIESNPRLVEAYTNRGVAREAKGDLDGAIADHTKAIEIDPRDVKAYINRGKVRRAKGDVDGAIADFTKAIEIDSRSSPAYFNRGNSRLARGELDAAIVDYTKAIEIDPRFASAHDNRGVARQTKGDRLAARDRLAEARVEWDGAIADHTKAIEIDPRQAGAYANRGIVRQTKGDLDGAIADCSKAIEIDPRFVEAYTNRARARQAKGDLDGAIADCTKALEVAPSNWKYRGQLEEYRKGLQRLK